MKKRLQVCFWFIWFVILMAVSAQPAKAKRLYHEKHYQEVWCNKKGGKTEVVLPDRSRVDCVIEGYAVEVDFADKWAESIGQSLLYGNTLGLHRGVLLILENPAQSAIYVDRFERATKGLDIRLWKISPDFVEPQR